MHSSINVYRLVCVKHLYFLISYSIVEPRSLQDGFKTSGRAKTDLLHTLPFYITFNSDHLLHFPILLHFQKIDYRSHSSMYFKWLIGVNSVVGTERQKGHHFLNSFLKSFSRFKGIHRMTF